MQLSNSIFKIILAIILTFIFNNYVTIAHALAINNTEINTVDLSKLSGFNDSTDKSSFFKRAADILSKTNGGELYLPSGEYNISSSFIEFLGFKKLTIRGDGKDKTTILLNDGADIGRPFRLREIDNLEVKGISIKNKMTTGSNNCLDVMNCKNVVIDGCYFSGASFYGLGLYQDTISEKSARVESVIIRDNEFVDIGLIGLEAFPKSKSNYFECYNNKFIRCGYNKSGFKGTPCAMKPGQSFELAKVHDNQIDDCIGGIYIANYINIDIYDNRIINVKNYPISVSIAQHPQSGSFNGFLNLVIRNNYIFNGITSDIKSRYPGININGTTSNNGSIIIKGNVLDGVWTGIQIRPSVELKDITLSSNKISNIQSGVALYVSKLNDNGIAANNIEISNNTFLNDKTSDINKPKIIVTNTANLAFKNNIFNGYTKNSFNFKNNVKATIDAL